jgi:hypothetical protein
MNEITTDQSVLQRINELVDQEHQMLAYETRTRRTGVDFGLCKSNWMLGSPSMKQAIENQSESI